MMDRVREETTNGCFTCWNIETLDSKQSGILISIKSLDIGGTMDSYDQYVIDDLLSQDYELRADVSHEHANTSDRLLHNNTDNKIKYYKKMGLVRNAN